MTCPFKLIYGENASMDGYVLRPIYDDDVLELKCECGRTIMTCHTIFCSLRKGEGIDKYFECVGEDVCPIMKK